MAGQNAGVDLFDSYFRRADLDGDGQISGAEAVAFFQASGLPKQVLAQVWMYADQRKAGYLGRQEFYNALKLVTVAQSKRDLTPDLVRAALYGAASSKIPAPKINLAATPAPKVAAPVSQFVGSSSALSQNAGIRPAQLPANAQMNQQYFPTQQNQFMRPQQGMPPNSISHQQQPPNSMSHQQQPPNSMPHQQQLVPSQGITTPPATRQLGSGNSTDWLSGSTSAPTSLTPNQGNTPSTRQDGVMLSTSGMTTSVQPRPLVLTGQIPSSQPQSQGTTTFSKPPVSIEPKALTVSENGFNTDSSFGNVFSASPNQPNKISSSSASSVSSSGVSSAIMSSAESLSSVKPSPIESLQKNVPQQVFGGQQTGKPNQTIAGQVTNARPLGVFPVASGNMGSGQSHNSWPRMTQADIQKYLKVFLQVDMDRDGKITGEQARNLFLSWRLPREVLKQVWDLSDQDNDSMLSAKEFCVALYLMERFREGRPLPVSLPSSVISDEALLSATSRPTASHAAGAWGPGPGSRQPQVMPGARPPHAGAPRPPRPPSAPQAEEKQPSQPKPKVPVLEKHLVDQLSQEEQDSLNSKFQEASQADKKVEELEKEISESRQKIDFYRAKMQELILYKSRCDNRLNEVIERVSSDKHEVDALAKKYEEKYKQAGDVASRLTIEEATFRDIQEKKMEVYRAIVKMEGGTAEGALKERADHIHSSLEELVKSLNERCKQYGLRAKPMSLVELPFGWQPGIQEGAADWDEDWDKFEDEGFTFVKELTTEMQNVVAPPKPKSVRKEKTTASEGGLSVSSSNAEAKSERISGEGESVSDKESPANGQSENGEVGTPPESPTRKTGAENQTHEVKGSAGADSSPHARGMSIDVADNASVFSGDKIVDEPAWGRFDSHYDSESIWGADSVNGKEADLESHADSSIYDIGDFGLNPIKTGTVQGKSSFMFDSVPSSPAYNNQGNNSSYTFDSVPSTPAYNQGKSSYGFDSVPGTPASYNQGKSSFGFDSVPGTPAYNQGRNSIMFDSVPSTPAHNQQQGMSSFGFADSVPSTPAYDLGRKGTFSSFADSVPGTPAYNFGSEDHSFDSFSRFDSFNLNESTSSFQSSAGPSLARFDSVRSTRDSDQGYGLPSRFDSFRETGDSDQGNGFSRFDSFRDSDQGQGFPSRFDSFRDSDHSQGFPSRFDSFRDSGDSDQGRGFSRFDSFGGGHDSGFDSGHDSKDHGFSSFDSDPFGSSGPFRTSLDGGATPSAKRSSDEWKAF
ncbi:unnamed protein product [Linum trigynum]|uniref:Uncharacterized protein n=1 Tax=Linum trigynum TaxID=586398 RepID=A0AAV2DUW6_9ROSI